MGEMQADAPTMSLRCGHDRTRFAYNRGGSHWRRRDVPSRASLTSPWFNRTRRVRASRIVGERATVRAHDADDVDDAWHPGFSSVERDRAAHSVEGDLHADGPRDRDTPAGRCCAAWVQWRTGVRIVAKGRTIVVVSCPYPPASRLCQRSTRMFQPASDG